MKKAKASIGLLALIFCFHYQVHAQFSLEQIMSSPFPSSLVASPKGDKVAWVFNAQGKRNLWVAEAPHWNGRQLTRYVLDDGQDVGDLAFSPDGKWIAFVRGGPPNSEKEIPNPTSDPAGSKQEVLLVSMRSRALTNIGQGNNPLFSPKGESVLFYRDDTLWSASVTGKQSRKAFFIRGRVSSPSWSPDGLKLLFVSERGDHSFISIYEQKSGTIRFLQQGVDRDIRPRWSPDGKRIAFIRLFNVVDTFSADKERISPWAIWMVDAKTGNGRQVWRSGEAEMDSYSARFGENVLQWADNDRLVFGSEHTGWAQLYSLLVDVGEVTALTSGTYEVENVTWSADRSFIVVSTNSNDIDRRHLWKVSIVDGSTQAITRGESIEMYPLVLSGGKKVAFCRSTATEPFLPFIASIDGSKMRSLAGNVVPKGFPAKDILAPEKVIFKAVDDVEIHGQLFKAKNVSPKTPAVLFLHGGPVRQMLLGWHYSSYYHNSYAFNQYLANNGYVVLSVNFRSGIGYGRAFREAKHRGPRGASEYQDVVAAAQYVRTLNYIDTTSIGLWGGSYGGYLTAMGLARNSDLFAAGVDIHGVHDWSARVGRSPWASGELAKLGQESSPIFSIDSWKSPVLLIHGDDDRNVAFGQTVDLVRKLREKRVDFEQVIFPDEVHSFLRHEHWLKAFHAAAEFFDKHLMNGKKMSGAK